MKITYSAIGKVQVREGFSIQLEPKWAGGLKGLAGFSHLIVLWHAGQSTWDDGLLTMPKPYRLAPESLGIFATRSPQRPNPICQTIVGVQELDESAGIIHCHYIDAAENSAVLDIKPWLACCDQPAAPHSPSWCAHWPATIEASGSFDWQQEFLFNT